MKKLGTLLVVAFIAVSLSTISAQEKYEANTENSTITWKGYKPTGSHEGTITLQSGAILIQDGKIKGGSFSVDMTSIKDTDGSARLEGHLKSADFFEVEAFPTANFKISGAIFNNFFLRSSFM